MSRIPLLLALAAALALAGCLGSGPTPGPADGDDPSPDQAPAPREARESPEPYAPGWPAPGEADVRPGVTVAQGTCTANFLFRSPDNRTLYLGAAAHCVPDRDPGDPVVVAGGYQGVLAYSSWAAQERADGEVTNEDNDFALVALPNSIRDEVHPAVRDAGGPTGVATDAARGDRVLAYGNSTLRPDAADPVRPREGYVTDRGPWLTSMYLAGPGVPGDSGSPVLTEDGRALGVLVHLEVLPEAGSNNAANLDALLDYANEHSDRTFQLLTWKPLGGSLLAGAG